ncbi:MAG: DUF3837 domain-containing protein [Lachnospiraceae bacterium]|nr:DUF3837 domain-containing protein [Lachnospiraceae bacterium]
MVPILAKQAINIKSKHKTNILLGNYECGYALGLIVNLSGILFPADYTDIEDLRIKVLKLLENYMPKDEREENLIHMLREYKADDNLDEQVKEMINMGIEEKKPWG